MNNPSVGRPIVLALATTLASCGQEPTNFGRPSDPAPDLPGVMIQSQAGAWVAEERMKELLVDAARDLAKALNDNDVRTMVHNALQGSEFPENKLHFRTLLEGHGTDLLTKMAEERQDSPGAVLARLDSLVDLEFYMPVPAHKEKWKGEANLIVATVLRDDGTIPDAFDLDGNRVPIASADEPPDTPALVIVPVETDFSRPVDRRTLSADAGPGILQSSSGDPGVYMTYSWIPHDYEGWPNGNPEFEIHPTIKNAAGAFDYVVCSGEQAPAPFQFNQDGTLYTNEVFAIAETAFGSYNDDRLRIEIWEDDSDPCTQTGGKAPKTSTNLVAPLVGLGVSGVSFTIAVIGGQATAIVGTAASLAGAAINFIVAAQQDDFVGRVDLTPETGCWPESGSTRFAVKDTNLNLTARVDLDFRTGDMREPICPLTASIGGPGYIETGSGSPVPSPNYQATWSGGQGAGPTFEWRLNGTLKSTSQNWTMSPVTTGNHTVKLTVVHGLDTVVKTKSVTVTNECTVGCGGGGEVGPPPGKNGNGN